jgi:membrane-associated phospholipid phosphatase
MGLLNVVAEVGAVVAGLHVLAAVLVVGPDRLRAAPRRIRANLSAVAPALAVLGIVLALNRVVRDAGVELSWIIGLNITGWIHAVEGEFIAVLQSVSLPALTAYFGFIYVFGYVFLLTFPLLAYLLHDEPRPLRVLLVTYVLNYALGLVCYVTFVAYGPRNFMPELVGSLLFTHWPQSQLLTAQVNVNTNVFPSLHASLSTTVALLAHRFRHVYPRWRPVAAVLAASIALSTMYLGIHWLTDVLAGVALAAATVAAATRVAADGNRGGRGGTDSGTERLSRNTGRWR